MAILTIIRADSVALICYPNSFSVLPCGPKCCIENTFVPQGDLKFFIAWALYSFHWFSLLVSEVVLTVMKKMKFYWQHKWSVALQPWPQSGSAQETGVGQTHVSRTEWCPVFSPLQQQGTGCGFTLVSSQVVFFIISYTQDAWRPVLRSALFFSWHRMYMSSFLSLPNPNLWLVD